MATIQKYETASGETRYRVRYRTPDNRSTQRRGFTTKRAAEAFAATVEVSKLKGECVAPANARITVDQLGPAWLERQRGHLKPSAYSPLEVAWRLRVQPRWGHVVLCDIRPTAVQQWVSDLSRARPGVKPPGASVVGRAHHVLSAILADAVRDNLIARNPTAGVKLPRITRKRPVYLTHQQVAALAAAAGEYEGFVLLLAYTGIRWGEAAACGCAIWTCCASAPPWPRTPSRSDRKSTLGHPRPISCAACRCPRSCCRTWRSNVRARTVRLAVPGSGR